MKKVMIIEDDPAILDVLGMLFKRGGYEVFSHPNGNFILKGEFSVPDLFINNYRVLTAWIFANT